MASLLSMPARFLGEPAAPIHGGTKFPLVQTLRGVAASWVVLYHAGASGHIPLLIAAMPAWLANVLFHWGHLGVPVFFALSGFVITHSLRDVPPTFGALGKFALRRSIRLDPPYWASIFFVLLMGFISARIKHESFALPDSTTILGHVAYLQVLLQQPVINTVYWTLTYEIQFYLFFATMLTLSAMVPAWRERARQAAWFGMFALAIISAVQGFAGLREGVFLTLWASFFAGVLAYKGIEHKWARLACLVQVFAMTLTLDSFMLISGGTAALLLVSSLTGWAQRKPLTQLGQRLGMISYSLYLIHNPITGAVGFIVRKFVHASIFTDMVTLIAMLVACIACSYGFWWVIERPSHRLTRLVNLR